MPTETETLFTSRGTFYQYAGQDSDRPYYKRLGGLDDFTIAIEMRKRSRGTEKEYVIVVCEDEDVVFEQPIGIELQLSFSAPAASVHWPSLIEGELEMVAFRFSAPENHAQDVTPQMQMQSFVDLYNRSTYSLLTGYENVDPEDEWYQYIGETSTHDLPNEDLSEPAYEFDIRKMDMASTGAGNICAAESLQFERVLVVRKGSDAATSRHEIDLRAIRQTERGFDQQATESTRISGVDGTSTGTLLEQGDTKMLLYGGRDSAVQQIDLSHGTVVQEFQPAEMDVQSVAYSQHTAARSGSVYTALGRNVAFNIDTRMDPRSCVVMEKGKQPTDYALSSLRSTLTCHATSQNGYLVIGDGSGNVRLHTGPPGARKPTGGYFPKAAKTLLDTKTPIVDIDVTADGKYIVATTATFLLFIETKYVDDNSQETNGFQGRMGKHKPQPVMLQPSPQQVMRLGGASAVRFTSAKFDRFPGTEELCVTASCGSAVLTWSLRAIIVSQSSGRSVVSSVVEVGQLVLATSANRAAHVGFLTGTDVGVVPFQETQKSVTKKWTWGQ